MESLVACGCSLGGCIAGFLGGLVLLLYAGRYRRLSTLLVGYFVGGGLRISHAGLLLGLLAPFTPRLTGSLAWGLALAGATGYPALLVAGTLVFYVLLRLAEQETYRLLGASIIICVVIVALHGLVGASQP
ncbi:MAG: hypothetical protein LRS48_06350 [Desulfurococcales archaeon]|nr:hypothetical protein [Desulfurococcales archaeon]